MNFSTHKAHSHLFLSFTAEDQSRKREIRLQKNREAARECRRKKKEYIKCLENRVAVLENQNKALIEELKSLKELYCQQKTDWWDQSVCEIERNLSANRNIKQSKRCRQEGDELKCDLCFLPYFLIVSCNKNKSKEEEEEEMLRQNQHLKIQARDIQVVRATISTKIHSPSSRRPTEYCVARTLFPCQLNIFLSFLNCCNNRKKQRDMAEKRNCTLCFPSTFKQFQLSSSCSSKVLLLIDLHSYF